MNSQRGKSKLRPWSASSRRVQPDGEHPPTSTRPLSSASQQQRRGQAGEALLPLEQLREWQATIRLLKQRLSDLEAEKQSFGRWKKREDGVAARLEAELSTVSGSSRLNRLTNIIF